MFNKNTIVGVIGAGAMGSGIAQVAATAGHSVLLFDTRKEAVEKAISGLSTTLNKLVEKSKISKEDADGILSRIKPAFDLKDLSPCGLVIEAIVEILSVKKEVFSSLETIVSDSTILASNTSSLSVTSIAAACKIPSRVIGLHFFNPAPLMPLVEVIPAVQTQVDLAAACKELMLQWKKVPVITKDTPGFIVNRVARPYYGEALRICEEGIADMATIDWALKDKAGFRMGP
ncbi:MAG TPA: 3-hydroxyacyl-CoA dehydrogenase NAD-binding domain-containing protein, partial [Bacteroidia bacterium]|nr:3-hydroxyacyl-CoA dehydrogenase NAD-binding domain-containing protein [Bacteroidia bacterium]